MQNFVEELYFKEKAVGYKVASGEIFGLQYLENSFSFSKKSFSSPNDLSKGYLPTFTVWLTRHLQSSKANRGGCM